MTRESRMYKCLKQNCKLICAHFLLSEFANFNFFSITQVHTQVIVQVQKELSKIKNSSSLVFNCIIFFKKLVQYTFIWKFLFIQKYELELGMKTVENFNRFAYYAHTVINDMLRNRN